MHPRHTDHRITAARYSAVSFARYGRYVLRAAHTEPCARLLVGDLLLVRLHLADRAGLGGVGIVAELVLGSPLPQQIPALVQTPLQCAQLLPILLQGSSLSARVRRSCSW